MTQLRRTASLLVAFYLLTSAATAYAECAWVLWETRTATGPTKAGEEPIPIGPTASDVVRAFANARECEEYLLSYVPILAKGLRAMTFGGHSIVQGTASDGFRVNKYVCLPDTVDPRGPKGK